MAFIIRLALFYRVGGGFCACWSSFGNDWIKSDRTREKGSAPEEKFFG
jgi:hypothetical protein